MHVRTNVPSSTGLEPLRSVYHNDDIISGILPTFINNLPNYLTDLDQAILNKDWKKAAGVCHKLKGTSSGYGYPEIAALASDLELEMLDQNPEAAAIDDLMARLEVLEQRAMLCLTEMQ